MTRLKRLIGLIVVLAAIAAGINAADLTLQYEVTAVAGIDWDGTGDLDGAGSVTFASMGDVKQATLSIICNTTAGYDVTLTTSNATAGGASVLKSGSNTIAYTATMGVSGVENATITAQTLDLTGAAPSLSVNFTGGSDVLPLDHTSTANEMVLTLTLANDSVLRPAGTYQDVITTTIAVN
ncbi:hypothetical protein SCG7086_CO_00020 [Chlamydiales bacterium SCGC AG-110-P3]|nr:hypothetical protein SCG7086_CO_00020 [Chlamydiales bacterium SCGC AG-110-P3]